MASLHRSCPGSWCGRIWARSSRGTDCPCPHGLTQPSPAQPLCLSTTNPEQESPEQQIRTQELPKHFVTEELRSKGLVSWLNPRCLTIFEHKGWNMNSQAAYCHRQPNNLSCQAVFLTSCCQSRTGKHSLVTKAIHELLLIYTPINATYFNFLNAAGIK